MSRVLEALTRRRALQAGAVAGLTAVAARPPAALALPGRPRSFGLRVADPHRTVRAPRRFDLVGVQGRAPAGLEVRVRARGGDWSRWVPLASGGDHRPDRPLADHGAGDPVWAGGAHELQLRGADAPVRLLFVSAGRGARRRGARVARAARRAAAAQAGAPPIIPRAAWGGDAVKPRADPEYGTVQVAFVHHTVNANDYTAEESAAIVLAIAKYHRDGNGWNDLGYNFVVDRFGQIFEGRAGGIDAAVIGAQAQGYNSVSTGIAHLGTFGAEAQTTAGIEACARLIAWKLPLHGAPVTGSVTVTSAGGDLNRFKAGTPVTLQRICGHRDGDATSCPGDALYAQLATIRARAAARAPAGGGPAVRLATEPLGNEAVAYGTAVTVRGRLARSDGGPVAGQLVEVQRDGTSAFVTVARTRTAQDGSWSARVTWRRPGRVRARADVAGARAVVSASVPLGLQPKAALSAAARRVRAGSSLAVTAEVRPAGRAQVLVEREVRPGVFQRVAKVPLRRATRQTVRIPLRRAGLHRLVLRVEVEGAAAVRTEPVFCRAVSAGASLDPAPAGGAGAPGGGAPTGGAGGP
jgi:hypothetical protein